MRQVIYNNVVPRWIPTRVLICVMTFTACWTSYMCRLQMPILAVPMIKALPGEAKGGACVSDQTQRHRRDITWLLDPGAYLEDYILQERLAEYEAKVSSIDNTRVKRDEPQSQPARGGFSFANGLPFDWTPRIRGQLIASYSYGNVPGNFIGGLMALRWGPRNAILWTSLVAAIVSLISPLIAQMHWTVLLVSRIIIGVTGGVTFPACHTLVAKWAPPQEKARFVWSLLGGTFGTILTYPMVAAIAETVNWESAWYIPSLLMMIWIAVFAVICYDSPAEHPGISEEEKNYILTSQQGTVRAKKPTWKQTPFRTIMTSVPFISLIICHFGNLFLLFFYQNSMMLYMTKALGFQLTKGGAAAGAPWAGRMIFGFFFSWAGDFIKTRQILTITMLRKVATIFSHLLPGIFLILVGYVGCSLLLANVFLVFALGFNGAASISNLSNNQDLSPNFAGFLYGIMNTIGCTTGMIIPPLVEEIAGKYGNPIEKWTILFWIGALVCIVCMVIFMIFGSGEIQSWNEIVEEEEPKKNDAEAGKK